ncbi:MAG: N-acetylmuramoyl-L-alanine amidase, partial [Acidimicrobiales bacterium]
MPATPSSRRTRRGAVAGLATLCCSAILVVVPTPTIVVAQTMAVRTEHVQLVPRLADRSGDQIGTAALSDGDGQALTAALGATGRRTLRRATATYHAIGITTPAAPIGPVLVRGRVDGQWTPWLEVGFEPGEAPDRGTEGIPRDGGAAAADDGGVHSEPVWIGHADAYELDAPGTLSALDVHLVGDGPPRRTVQVATPAAGAAGAPAILPRSAWSAQPPRDHPTVSGDLKLAIVHHSVNSNTYSASDVPALLRSIQTYHKDVKGWQDIAYNFVVDRFGRTWEGRAGGTTQVVAGGHSQGFNTGSTGVVVLGDFRSAAVPSAAVESVARVIAWKLALHRVDPASTVPFTSAGSAKYAAGVTVTLPRIVGHRDVQSTDCPGLQLYRKLGTIRARVAQLVPAYQQGLVPVLLAPDVTGDQLVDPLQYSPGGTPDVLWRSSPTGPHPSGLSVSGAYRPAVGDFDGNGYDDVFWHGTGSTPDSIWWAGPGGFQHQAVTVSGSYVPVVGDYDGDGRDDVLWYATGLAADSVWYFGPDRTHANKPVDQDLITGVPLMGDFDGDGRDDVFWYGPGAADDYLWKSTGRGFVSRA